MTHNYRADIDGLRAIAVLSVVLYHFGVPGIVGGFIGVDIFLVISGFLITKIIAHEVEAGSFSFANFYDRRIRRIFPALFVVLFFTLAASWFILLPSDLHRLGINAIATLLFASNVVFWRQSGYFDVQSDYNPLLHTWSLAVEEQFYVLFPIALILIYRFAKNHRIAVLLSLTALSFALCVLVQQRLPGAAFYLSPFRAWELLVGALLAIGNFSQPKARMLNETLALVALGALLGCFALIEENANFPGWIAMVPVLATVILIYTGNGKATLVSALLGSRPFVFVGLISYSLYLWHWPVFVYASYTNGYAEFSAAAIVGLVLFSVLLAYLTYRWVETPFRKRGPGAIFYGHLPLFRAALVGTLGLALIAFAATNDQGWQSRVPAQVAKLDAMRTAPIPGQQCNGIVPGGSERQCSFGAADLPSKALLWGDSHAMAWSPVFTEISQTSNRQLALAVNSACPPLLNVDNPAARNCAAFNADVFDYIKKTHPTEIYLVASWLSYSSPDGQYELRNSTQTVGNVSVFAPALQNTLQALAPYTDRIILVGPTPGAPKEIPYRKALFDWRTWGGQAKPISKSQFDQRLRWFERAVAPIRKDAKVILVDPAAWFCDTLQCAYAEDGKLLYRDDGHLSLDGAAFVKNRLQRLIVSTEAR